MYKFTRHSRDSGLAKSSAIVKGFWFAALAAVISMAGIVAKVNPGKPMGSTTNVKSGTLGSTQNLSGGYDVIGPSLSAPPGTPVTPQQTSPSSSSSPTQAPAPVASGAS